MTKLTVLPGALIAAVFALLMLAAPGRAAAELPCKALTDIGLPHATVTKVTVETLGAARACRFAVTSKPTSDSDIRIEVWIPVGDAWNGKFVQLGNGGFAGSIRTPMLQAVAARGYAVAATDNGHQSSVGTDAAWALRHPEKVVDFGWRSLKETTDIAKTLISAQKGSPPIRSYFSGCSDGGREALMEAQRFPDDFDGIAAGAPAANFSHLMAGGAWTQQALLNAPGAWIGPSQLAVLQAAALRQCGRFGYIQDPLACRFDPAVTLCKDGQDPSSCLAEPQVAAARAIYAGPRAPDGTSLYPGYAPGAEAESGGWEAWITGSSFERAAESRIYQFANNFFRFMDFGDPKYDILKLGFGEDFAAAKAATTQAVDAVNPDLRAFRAHGGKLIQYHGWNDPAIPGAASIVYYEDVRRTLGDVSGFYRLFMVPGMLHCAGGPGPGTVDWLGELDAWVGGAPAPDQLLATNDPSPFAPPPAEPQPRRRQILCAWPAVASGSPDSAAGARCIGASVAPPPAPPTKRPKLRRRR